MGWGRYAQETGARVSELEALLTKDDVSDLRTLLSRQSKAAWATWMSNHHQLALAYIAASPSERNKAARFRLESGKLLLLRVTALVLAKQGHALIEAMSMSCLVIGLGYRQALAEAADVAEKSFFAADPFWPLAAPSPWD